MIQPGRRDREPVPLLNRGGRRVIESPHALFGVRLNDDARGKRRGEQGGSGAMKSHGIE